jgi:hypothetical protein
VQERIQHIMQISTSTLGISKGGIQENNADRSSPMKSKKEPLPVLTLPSPRTYAERNNPNKGTFKGGSTFMDFEKR